MSEAEPVAFKVVQQGAPVPNTAWYRYKSDQCLVIELDMHSKRTEVGGSGGSQVFIDASEHSLHLHATANRDDATLVEFDLPEGEWSLAVGGRSGRYSLTFTYLKGTP